MAVNLLNSDDIEVTKSGENIQLNTTTSIANILSSINDIDSKLPKVETIYSGSISSGTDTLNKSIENYDFLLVVVRGATYTRGTSLIPVSLVTYGSTDATPFSIVAFQSSGVYASVKLNFTDATTISVSQYTAGWGSANLENIIGIKL